MSKPNAREETFELWIINLIADKVAKKSVKYGQKMGFKNDEVAVMTIRAYHTMEGWLCEKFPHLTSIKM